MSPSALVAASGPDSLVWWGWIGAHGSLILQRLAEHLVLTLEAVAVGTILAGLSAVATRNRRRLQAWLVGFTGTLYTIPSLALFALLGPLTGFTTRTTTEIALVSYTLLILLRNFLTGLAEVPVDVAEAATAMGYSPLRRLWEVDLPLALPGVIAGLRIATVTTIGLVTIAALFGQGGLGSLILDGLNRDFHTPVVVGSVLSVALAVVVDVALLMAERTLTPWAKRRLRT